MNDTIGLNQLVQAAPRQSLISTAPAGIDDFLAHYTLQSRSISEFMSCLDSPETESFVGNFDRVITPSDPHVPAKCVFPTQFTTKGANEAVPNTDGRKSQKAKSTTICKRLKLTPEIREERRRHQNREAQRRFREKHMFPSHQTPFTHTYSDVWAQGPGFSAH